MAARCFIRVSIIDCPMFFHSFCDVYFGSSGYAQFCSIKKIHFDQRHHYYCPRCDCPGGDRTALHLPMRCNYWLFSPPRSTVLSDTLIQVPYCARPANVHCWGAEFIAKTHAFSNNILTTNISISLIIPHGETTDIRETRVRKKTILIPYKYA